MALSVMLYRTLLIAMSPVALVGGTVSSWQGDQPAAPSAVPGLLAHPVAPAPLQVAPGPDSLIHARVVINGQSVNMIVDTGASRTLLSERDADRVFGASPRTPAGQIRTLSGDQDLFVLPASSVKLGGRLYRNLDAGVVEGGSLSVLGLDWLELAGPVTLAR